MLYFIGKGIFTTDGPFWQHSRSILRPNFDKSLISALDQFEPYVQKLIGRIPKDGSTVDLQDLFHQLSMDTSTDFILENGTDYLGGDQNAAMLDESINKCVEYGSWREMTDPFYWLVPNAEAKKALKYAHAAVDGWVKQAMEHKDSADLDGKGKDSGKRYVFINELARHKEVDAIRIRDEVMNIILAGKDTTASLLSGLWFCLAREPEVYKKLQAEVAELNGERPSYESLRNMKYLKYTVQEGEDVPDFHLPLTRKTLTKTSFPSPPPLHPSPTLRQTRPQRHRPPPRRR
jgi:cytochrome P450